LCDEDRWKNEPREVEDERWRMEDDLKRKNKRKRKRKRNAS
jgi:hypothetical protein